MDDVLNAPEWNRRKANALMLAQAARLEALVDLLERKQIITRSELAGHSAEILHHEKARLIATMSMPDETSRSSSSADSTTAPPRGVASSGDPR
jgi:hypothetical protein